MINYDALQDFLTAILVIIVVSFVICLAWLSTNVREQPLVAFVVFRSSNNGEREQTLRNRDNNTREAQGTSEHEEEATLVGQTVEVNESVCHKKAGMEVQQLAKEDCAGDSSAKEACDTNLQVERVNDISVKELEKGDTISSLPQANPIEGEDEFTSSSREADDDNMTSKEGSDPSPPSQSPPEKQKNSLPETELRKRRLQQFISMGDTTTTTHLERLSEQLAATLPTEVSDQQSTTEDTKSNCNEGAKVEEVSSNECVADVLSSTQNVSGDGMSVNENVVKEDERPPGSIKIRLKFLDETQRFVFAQLTEQIGSFKRQHFSIEMDANRRIRLIFNGQLLSQDTSTLAQCGLFDNCVVHCHVSQPQQNSTILGHSRDATAQDEEDAYVSRLLAPLLYGVLAVMWYLRYEYGHLFNAMSTLILLFLTALLLVSTYLLYVTHHLQDSPSVPATTLPQPQSS